MKKPKDSPGLVRLRAMNAGPRLTASSVLKSFVAKVAADKKPRRVRKPAEGQVELF